ncbi:MAG: hypothetical protein HC812_07620, partial [Leptolyngbya sp. RL_3_1]|nr:hypothetical protein [Leptolyngbya sp. RL_3_1]
GVTTLPLDRLHGSGETGPKAAVASELSSRPNPEPRLKPILDLALELSSESGKAPSPLPALGRSLAPETAYGCLTQSGLKLQSAAALPRPQPAIAALPVSPAALSILDEEGFESDEPEEEAWEAEAGESSAEEVFEDIWDTEESEDFWETAGEPPPVEHRSTAHRSVAHRSTVQPIAQPSIPRKSIVQKSISPKLTVDAPAGESASAPSPPGRDRAARLGQAPVQSPPRSPASQKPVPKLASASPPQPSPNGNGIGPVMPPNTSTSTPPIPSTICDWQGI